MAKDNLLFNSEKIENPVIKKNVKCDMIEDFNVATRIHVNCYESGNNLVFMNWNDTKATIPIPDILSVNLIIEKKRFGEKSLMRIETSNYVIDVLKATNVDVDTLNNFRDVQKEKMLLTKKSKKITFRNNDSTKTITIHPYSPIKEDGEEIIFEDTLPDESCVVTNYRVWKNFFFQKDGISMTHDEYNDVIAGHVTKRREEDIIGSVEETPSMWNLLSQYTRVQLYYNKSTHHASSTEIEVGDIIFMKNGKQVMIWKNYEDPNTIVKIINSAKANFNTKSDNSSPEGEDPIKILKLRFANGEITKEEFLEMKNLLE